MRRFPRKVLLLTGALILGASITTLRANAIESTNYVVGPISMFGSYGGGTTASEKYRVTLSWTSMSGRISSSSRQTCLGFLCYSTGTSIFASMTVKSP